MFHDVRFPAAISFGSVGGPERRTEIVQLSNGAEERNTPWAQSRRRYDAGVGMRSLDDLATLIAFFEARRGQLYGFRWKDWADHRSGLPTKAASPTDQTIGVGDGATASFALVKRYESGGMVYDRPIAKPVAGSVRVAVDGVEVSATLSGGSVVLDAAPAAGAAVTAGFEFDVPVRFDTDRLEVSVDRFEAGELPSVPVVEVRL